ncbi:MAG: TatD family hydrolase [Patescibacteria group bacterium]
MPLYFIDAHAHVQFPAYNADRAAVLARARAAGVAVVNAGTTFKTSADAVVLARAHARVYATVGIHPGHAGAAFHDPNELGLGDDPEARRIAAEGERFDAAAFRKLAADSKVVGVGECGLDYFRIENGEPGIKEKQKELFIAQVRFAHEIGKPLVIHCRPDPTAASGDVIADLTQLLVANDSLLNRNNPGIMHFFSGTVEEARRLLDLGFSFTFGGAVTLPHRAGKPDYADLVRSLPLDRILSETDAPYVAPLAHRGKRSEPAYVIEVVEKIAEIKNMPTEEIAERIRANACRVFGITLAGEERAW